MIALEVKGEFLDLPSDLSIEVKLKNKLFFRTTIPGIHTYSIDIPASPKNNRLLGYRNVIEADSNTAGSISGSLYLEGERYATGVLKIRDAGPNQFRGNFEAFNSDLQPLKDKTLNDFDLGKQFYPYELPIYRNLLGITCQAGEEVELDVNGTTFTQSFASDNFYTVDTLAKRITNAFAPDIASKAFLNGTPDFSQTSYSVDLVIETVDRNTPLNVAVAGNNTATIDFFLNSGDLAPFIQDQLTANADLGYPDVSLCFPTMFNPDHYPRELESNQSFKVEHDRLLNDYGFSDRSQIPGYIQAGNVLNHIFQQTEDTEEDSRDKNLTRYLKPLVPCVFVKHILKKVFEQVGLQVKGSFIEDPGTDNFTILGLRAADRLNGPFGDYLDTNANPAGWYIDVNSFTPDIKLIDLLKDVALTYFNLVVDTVTEPGTVLLNYASDYIKSVEHRSAKRTFLYNIRYDEPAGFNFDTLAPSGGFYSENSKSPTVLASKTENSPVNSNSGLPQNGQDGAIRLVRNQNMYYLFDQRWLPYSFDYRPFEPLGDQAAEEITPKGAITPALEQSKRFYRVPVVQFYFSKSGGNDVAINLNGTTYFGSAGNRIDGLNEIAEKINNDLGLFEANASLYHKGGNTYPVLTVQYFAREFDYDFFIVGNFADTILARVLFPANPKTNNNNLDGEVAFLMPSFKEKGLSFAYESAADEMPHRYFFYRGLQPSNFFGDPEYKYPLGTPDVYDANGNKVGEYALRWDGPEGLYNQFWDVYNRTYSQAKDIEAEFLMDFKELLSLNIGTQLESEGNRFWWRELQFRVDMESGIQPVKAKLLKQH
jgi:hypothetical protein